MKNTLLFVCTLLLPLIIAFSCSSGDSQNIATALEDRLTDALDFEGGEYHEDEKPAGSSGADAPQISNVDGPEEFRLGAGFAIALFSEYDKADKIDKAIVWVKGARGYISVPGMMAEKLMEIAGTLAADAELQGEDFVIQLALQTEGGRTGLYKSLDFQVADQEAQNVEDPVDSASFSGGVSERGDRPEGSDSVDAPQIREVDAPTELKPGQEFEVRLYTDFSSHEEVDGAIFSAPGSYGYIEIAGQLEEALPVEVPNVRGRTIDPPGKWVMIISGEMDRKMSTGDILTYMWALKAGALVGLYRSSEIVIGEGVSPDGDEDEDLGSDGDRDAEPDEDPVVITDGDLDEDVEEDSTSDGDSDTDDDLDTDPDPDPDPDIDSDGDPDLDPDKDPDPQEEGEGDLNCPEGWYDLDENPDDCEYQCILPEGQTEPDMEICDGHDNNCNGTVDEAAFCSPRDNASVICDFGCQYTCDNSFHDCNEACVDVNSIDHCGSSCDPCPDVDNATTSCNGVDCGFQCLEQFHFCTDSCVSDNSPDHCGGSCTPCPTPANGSASCDGADCGFNCDSQYHTCGDECVSVNSIDHCGSNCSACPSVANGNATCDGVDCGFVCAGDYHACADSCVSVNSIDHCGDSCSPCPVPNNGSATCDGIACGFACNTGYHACSDDQCYADNDTNNCGPSCTVCTDQPNSSPICQNNLCGIACDSGWYNLDNDDLDGCEFSLNPEAIYVSVQDAMSDDDAGCGSGPVGTGDGNRPCFSITAGLREADNRSKAFVLVAEGTYIETVTLIDGVILLGGHDSMTWERDTLNSPTVVNTYAAGSEIKTVIAENISSNTKLDGFTIIGSDNGMFSGNSYAIHLTNAGSLEITNNIIQAGSGGSGSNGSAGSSGQTGVGGVDGSDAYDTGTATCFDENQGGGGGALTCGVDVSGGDGGGVYCEPSYDTQTSASPGADGNWQGSQGLGGTAGYDAMLDPGAGCLCSGTFGPCTGGDGNAGSDGGNGDAGPGCTAASGTVNLGKWSGYAGEFGSVGADGSGGGGGGAGGGGDASPFAGLNDTLGGTGGGGGSGGCRGAGGFGGAAGGGVFGIFINGGDAPLIENNQISLGTGGSGGDGGAGGNGGTGGGGGTGGAGGGECLFAGGDGGDGGNGGHGGGGGGGCGGVSFGIFSAGLTSTPDYCDGATGNTFNGGSAGAGGTGGGSSGNPGSDGTDGLAGNCGTPAK